MLLKHFTKSATEVLIKAPIIIIIIVIVANTWILIMIMC